MKNSRNTKEAKGLKSNGRKEAIIRVIILGITWLNAILTATGKNPIPFDESAVTEVLSYIISGAVAVWTWWKNNNVTQKAIDRDHLAKMKIQ